MVFFFSLKQITKFYGGKNRMKKDICVFNIFQLFEFYKYSVITYSMPGICLKFCESSHREFNFIFNQFKSNQKNGVYIEKKKLKHHKRIHNMYGNKYGPPKQEPETSLEEKEQESSTVWSRTVQEYSRNTQLQRRIIKDKWDLDSGKKSRQGEEPKEILQSRKRNACSDIWCSHMMVCI